MSSQKKVTIEAIEESSGESVKKGQKSRLDLLEMKYRSLVCEKRMMFVMFLLTLLGTLLFIISFSTPYWIYVSLSKLQERLVEDSRSILTANFVFQVVVKTSNATIAFKHNDKR